MNPGFEWDAEKAASNLAGHGITFEEAARVFVDPLALDMADPAHSDEEERFIRIGQSNRERLLVVVYTERGDKMRIVSARPATRRERRAYEES